MDCFFYFFFRDILQEVPHISRNNKSSIIIPSLSPTDSVPHPLPRSEKSKAEETEAEDEDSGVSERLHVEGAGKRSEARGFGPSVNGWEWWVSLW